VSVLGTVRVTAVPSMVAVPRISIVAPLGVLPLVVRVSSPEAFGPRVGGEKVAVTPAGSGPVPRVVRPVKPPVVTVLTWRLTLVPAMVVTVVGSTVRLKSGVGRTMKWPVEVAVPPEVVTEMGPVVAPARP
jgi:hypothetical protein